MGARRWFTSHDNDESQEGHAMRSGRVLVALMVGGMAVALAKAADKPPIPPHGPAEVLFDGKSLNAFDSFLKTKGLNSDPEHVFTVEHGMIHVSGKEMGYLITKQPFHDFYLRAEVKWGEGTYGERAGNGRDGKRVTGPPGSALMIPRFDKAPAENLTGFRSPTGEVERPHGKWNVLELVTDGNTVRQYVNGKLVNEGTDPFPKEGKILFQSEGAEVYFRDIKLYPLQ